MIWRTICLVAAAGLALTSLGSFGWHFYRRRRNARHPRLAILSLGTAVVALIACVGLSISLAAEVASRGRRVATSAYHRAGDALVAANGGCPVGLPFDGPQKRIEVITCGSPGGTVKLPENTKVLKVGDDYIPANPDGSYLAVVQADPEAVRRIVAAPPPWGEAWVHGPMQQDLFESVNPTFDPPYDGIRTSTSTVYSIVDFSKNGDKLNAGNLIALDEQTGRVWFAYWDF